MARFFIKSFLSMALLVLLGAVRVLAAPVQEATSTINGSISLSSDCAVGDLVTLYIGDESAGPPNNFVTAFSTFPTQGDWIWVTTAATATPAAGGWLFAINCAVPSQSVSWSGTTASQAVMTEWSGYNATAIEQLVSAAHSSGLFLSPGSFTITNADDLIVAEI